MDTTVRKRGCGRPSKASRAKVQMIVPHVTADSMDESNDSSHLLDVSALAISPVPGEQDSSALPNNLGDIRRSSRKKIIKFDVRDLLNKNRKLHKIQIEARIDSNAPVQKKPNATQLSSSSTVNSLENPLNLNKQKAFLEKSAIFEKYSINASPVKPPPTPNLLLKSDNSDIDLGSSTSNLLRAKRNSSLIVAKMDSTPKLIANCKIVTAYEANNDEDEVANEGLKGRRKTKVNAAAKTVTQEPETETVECVKTPIVKRRGRQPKIKIIDQTPDKQVIKAPDQTVTTTNETIDDASPCEKSTRIDIETTKADVATPKNENIENIVALQKEEVSCFNEPRMTNEEKPDSAKDINVAVELSISSSEKDLKDPLDIDIKTNESELNASLSLLLSDDEESKQPEELWCPKEAETIQKNESDEQQQKKQEAIESKANEVVVPKIEAEEQAADACVMTSVDECDPLADQKQDLEETKTPDDEMNKTKEEEFNEQKDMAKDKEMEINLLNENLGKASSAEPSQNIADKKESTEVSESIDPHCVDEKSTNSAKLVATLPPKKKLTRSMQTKNGDEEESADDTKKETSTSGKITFSRSDSQTSGVTKKTTRRSDRRGQIGAKAKTLEEMFAEIAAESSREVLQSPIIASDDDNSSSASSIKCEINENNQAKEMKKDDKGAEQNSKIIDDETKEGFGHFCKKAIVKIVRMESDSEENPKKVEAELTVMQHSSKESRDPEATPNVSHHKKETSEEKLDQSQTLSQSAVEVDKDSLKSEVKEEANSNNYAATLKPIEMEEKPAVDPTCTENTSDVKSEIKAVSARIEDDSQIIEANVSSEEIVKVKESSSNEASVDNSPKDSPSTATEATNNPNKKETSAPKDKVKRKESSSTDGESSKDSSRTPATKSSETKERRRSESKGEQSAKSNRESATKSEPSNQNKSSEYRKTESSTPSGNKAKHTKSKESTQEPSGESAKKKRDRAKSTEDSRRPTKSSDKISSSESSKPLEKAKDDRSKSSSHHSSAQNQDDKNSKSSSKAEKKHKGLVEAEENREAKSSSSHEKSLSRSQSKVKARPSHGDDKKKNEVALAAAIAVGLKKSETVNEKDSHLRYINRKVVRNPSGNGKNANDFEASLRNADEYATASTKKAKPMKSANPSDISLEKNNTSSNSTAAKDDSRSFSAKTNDSSSSHRPDSQTKKASSGCLDTSSSSVKRRKSTEVNKVEVAGADLDSSKTKKQRQRKLKDDIDSASKETPDKKALATCSTASKVETAPKSKEEKAKATDSSSTLTPTKSVPEDNEEKVTKKTCGKNGSQDPLGDIEKFIADGVSLLKKEFDANEDPNANDNAEESKGQPSQSSEGVKTKAAVKQNDSDLHVASSVPSPPAEASAEAPATAPLSPAASTVSEGLTVPVTVSVAAGPVADVNEKAFYTDSMFTGAEQDLMDPMMSSYLTPANTPSESPVQTPLPSPMPPSPAVVETPQSCVDEEESPVVRRSHRLKQNVKGPKEGRGLVREKERVLMKEDGEMKISYSVDDHLTDLAEVEAINAKFLKEMEERLSNFHVIRENEYHCERVISKEAKRMVCECFLTPDEEERGELGCGDECLNRLLMIECGSHCKVKERCTNRRFQKQFYAPCRVFRTEKKGFGILADVEILPGEFIMEYVGEVISGDDLTARQVAYSKEKNRHYYFMALRGDTTIDATVKGNISRFINHSCDPNAETQKWTVNGELRIGFFSLRSIKPGEEITFNYQYERYGREAQRCYCESSNCSGWIGEEPNSDEDEQVEGSGSGSGSESDEDAEGEEEEVEDKVARGLKECLLNADDDESSEDEAQTQKKSELAAAEQKQKQKASDKAGFGKDAKAKLRQLFNKIKERAEEKKKIKKENKIQNRRKRKDPKSEGIRSGSCEDPEVEDELNFLIKCGLKNQSDTLRLSRLMVRAKLLQTRLDILKVLSLGELACRRLFLDYNGLPLLHSWMSEYSEDLRIRSAVLDVLASLPIANKTILKDTKVYQTVLGWSSGQTPEEQPVISPTEGDAANTEASKVTTNDSTGTETANKPASGETGDVEAIQKLALELINNWNNLPEIFRIPKKERLEQMKEHEREADLQYDAAGEDDFRSSYRERYGRDRYGAIGGRHINTMHESRRRNFLSDDNLKHLSKAERREMFAAKVAKDEQEKRANEKRREFETKCRFFGLSADHTNPHDMPFYVNHDTGQWYSIRHRPIPTPPAYAHVGVPIKPKSTNPEDYQLPEFLSQLPTFWKYAISPEGFLYYYHIEHRIPQWEPPAPSQLVEHHSDSDSEINHEDDELLLSLNDEQLKEYIKKKAQARVLKRNKRLYETRPISPRREEDRVYNQIEMRKYKENKEKMKKRKEKLRRRAAMLLKKGEATTSTTTTTTATPTSNKKSEDDANESIPIPDYLLSSDEEADVIGAAEIEITEATDNLIAARRSSLLDKIVDGDKYVDELDALTLNKTLKRSLPPHGDILKDTPNDSPSTSATAMSANESSDVALTPEAVEAKRRKMERRERMKKGRERETAEAKVRRYKEKFRQDIKGIISHYLKPYYNETCTVGRIQNEEDYKYLCRKLIDFVTYKEKKYSESIGQKLVFTESVKNKTKEFIRKYMSKYGEVFQRPENETEYKSYT